MQKGVYKRSLLVPTLKILFDVVAVEAAVLAAYYLRFYSPLTAIFPVTKGYPPLANYLYFSAFLVVVFVGLFASFRSYRSRFFSTFGEDIPVVLKTCFLGILFGMSGAFLYRDFSYSRLVFALIYVTSNLFLLIGRWLFHRIKEPLLRRGFNVLRVYLVGSEEVLPRLWQRFEHHLPGTFHLEGYIAPQPIHQIPLEYRGSLSQLPQLLAQNQAVDGLLIAFDQADHRRVLEVIRATEGKNVELFYVPDILDILTSRVHTLEIAGIPVLQLKAFILSGWQGFLKRTFDVVVAGAALVLLSPLMLLIAAIIKLTSPGPVLYKQERVGLDGREFVMLKFRTMRVDAEAETGPVWAKPNDPRVTPVGRILRRTSFDELPQLINVLKGEMSLVGPRPERRHFVEQFRKLIPGYLERHRVRCGMTGWAQVNGLRGQSPIEERTRYDLYYIENWSLWFDIKIIILTFLEIIRGENAY
ncbi:MAG: undecaprenyl-phosphate glucose phosphotransferase [Calditrichaeota bacterium]|nr:MAG: undecaprenyl-phosphate glucose phosphotransferase [Calditrichota bacterium]